MAVGGNRSDPRVRIIAPVGVQARAKSAGCFRFQHNSGLLGSPAGALDAFQSVAPITLESLEKTFFPFASRRAVKYLDGTPHHPKGFSVFMIVCSCNVLSDDDVRNAVNTAQELPRNAKQIYGCLGCSAECGRCARTIKTILAEALGACAEACRSGCPHRRTTAHRHVDGGLASEAAT